MQARPVLARESHAVVAQKSPTARRGNGAEDDDKAGDESASYQELRRIAARRPVVKRRFGVDVEWAETDAAGSQGVRSLQGRIFDSNVAALVILDGFVGGEHFEPLLVAAHQTGTLSAYGDTAGTAALSKAFSEIEQKLSGR